MIEHKAQETAVGALSIAERLGDIASLADKTERLSDGVSDAATALSRAAHDLEQATESFVAQLTAA